MIGIAVNFRRRRKINEKIVMHTKLLKIRNLGIYDYKYQVSKIIRTTVIII